MTSLTVYIGLVILLTAGDAAAIYGHQAKRLGLPGWDLVHHIAWLAPLIYVAGVVPILRLKKRSAKWLGFVGIILGASAVAVFPMFLLHWQTVRIPLAASPTKETEKAFKAVYPMQWLSGGGPEKDAHVRIRKEDYSPEEVTLLKGLIATQEKPQEATSSVRGAR